MIFTQLKIVLDSRNVKNSKYVELHFFYQQPGPAFSECCFVCLIFYLFAELKLKCKKL